MSAILILIWVLSGVFAIWLQFRYRDKGYPENVRWLSLLFLSGFINGVMALLAFTSSNDVKTRLLLLLFSGIFGGLIFAFGFPHQMRELFPKR